MTKYDEYEMTIGIECHVQLKTKTKLFSRADNDAHGKAPNTVINHIDWALPGMLPVLNKEAVILATRAAKALGATVNKISRFDRKHYFYPDLPKGYQTSQLYQPIIGSGVVKVDNGEEKFEVRIEHAHLEEDAGKLTHGLNTSYVDLNRSGTPLIEIVTLPDIHSASQAKAFAQELHRLMIFSGVTLGDLYEGNMRFDVNLSVAKKGSTELGTRTETKNLNSFRSIERAIEYEFRRQIDELEAGRPIKQETRGFEDATGRTFSQRSKEEAKDYRYMPDPDIPPIVLTDEMIAEMQANMPLLPNAYREKWLELKLDQSVIDTMLVKPEYAQAVTSVLDKAGAESAKMTAYWLASALESQPTCEFNSELIDRIIELTKMTLDSKLSSTNAKIVFNELLVSDKTPLAIAEEKQLLQVSDSSVLEEILDQVLNSEQGQKALEDVKAGNMKAMGFIVGQSMKLSKGQANPQIINQMLQRRLK
ncbi:MAG: Asp-tRNA(Asn)/Glu-tRNA(Gln) amidotransferase subunit GatB [Candidatus Saccharibacteria bacterium]|nr:Asp-tRNA(Asn)/Glu-tRNA(Gln) amidotransferase subunit GatB [Candidatus Saccharibacteria bacterium]